MMQKEKIWKRSFLLAVAAASVVAAPATVKADGEASTTPTAPTGKLADAGITSVSVNGKAGILEIGSAQKEVLVATGKANVKRGTITVSAWDVYEPKGNKVKVDMSKMKNTVDNYLVLGTNSTDNISIVKIPVAAKYTKVKFDAAKSVLQVGTGATSAEAAPKDLTEESAKKFQYRTAYSQWTDMFDGQNLPAKDDKLPDFTFYQENGTQLYIRLKGGESATALTGDPDGKEKLAYNGQKDATPVYTAENSNLPGKEAKVSIKAKAKGPSVTADYANGTVKIPKNSEWRLVTKEKIFPEATGSDAASAVAYYTTLTDGKANSVTDVFKAAGQETLSEAGLEVRKAASGTKAASKWNRITIEKLKDLEANKDFKAVAAKAISESKKSETGAPPAATTTKQEYTGGGIGTPTDGAAVYEDGNTSSSVFKIEYATTGTKTKTNIIKITSNGRYAYEIRIGAKGAEAAPTDGKATKIAAATTRAKTVTLKKVDDFSTVWIRRAGDKKTKTWATNWAKLGDVDYPYVVEAQAAPTPTPTPTPTSGTT